MVSAQNVSTLSRAPDCTRGRIHDIQSIDPYCTSLLCLPFRQAGCDAGSDAALQYATLRSSDGDGDGDGERLFGLNGNRTDSDGTHYEDSKEKFYNLAGAEHEHPIANRHDHDKTRLSEGQNNQAEPNVLQTLLDKRANLNLTGKVHRISPVQQNHGGYSDIFTGYLSFAAGIEVKVAVKKLRVHVMGDAKLQKKLARELYIWSKLNHPRILPLEGFYLEDNNYPFLISKWMDNGTVLSFLRKKPNADLLSLVIGIVEGVVYLHGKEVVHSDIKPDNILISERGEPLLCDFGISRMLEASRTMTFNSSTHSLRGTYRFMAKELLDPPDAQAPSYTKESDVWALGMTIATLVTKRHPFAHLRTDAQVITAVLNGLLPSPPAHMDLSPQPALNILIWHMCTLCWRSLPHMRITVGNFLTSLKSIQNASGWIDMLQISSVESFLRLQPRFPDGLLPVSPGPEPIMSLLQSYILEGLTPSPRHTGSIPEVPVGFSRQNEFHPLGDFEGPLDPSPHGYLPLGCLPDGLDPFTLHLRSTFDSPESSLGWTEPHSSSRPVHAVPQ